MLFGRPSMLPLLVIRDIEKALSEYESIGTLSAGIGVYGPAAAYALVWELGSLRLKSPGPKTVWGTNRYGQKVILTKQAPEGYVAVAEDQFWPIIERELSKVNFKVTSSKEMALRLEIAMDNASQAIARVVSDLAPVDTGQLRSEILGIDSDETNVLDSQTDSELAAEGTLLL